MAFCSLTHFASEEGRSTRDVTFGVLDCAIVTALTRSMRVDVNRRWVLKRVNVVRARGIALVAEVVNIGWK